VSRPISNILAVQRTITLAPDLYCQLAKQASEEGLGLQAFVHLLLQRALKDVLRPAA